MRRKHCSSLVILRPRPRAPDAREGQTLNLVRAEPRLAAASHKVVYIKLHNYRVLLSVGQPVPGFLSAEARLRRCKAKRLLHRGRCGAHGVGRRRTTPQFEAPPVDLAQGSARKVYSASSPVAAGATRLAVIGARKQNRDGVCRASPGADRAANLSKPILAVRRGWRRLQSPAPTLASR